MDMSKKSLILSIIATFVCLAVAAVCLVFMKLDLVSVILSAVLVALAIYICLFCYKVAKQSKKDN
ncbi:MAG: hypothetical protein IJS74_03530 [Clostridia bacterium]|nr:hypothetical protein [Clostridia bacterium]